MFSMARVAEEAIVRIKTNEMRNAPEKGRDLSIYIFRDEDLGGRGLLKGAEPPIQKYLSVELSLCTKAVSAGGEN
jgi:hypothetical protein